MLNSRSLIISDHTHSDHVVGDFLCAEFRFVLGEIWSIKRFCKLCCTNWVWLLPLKRNFEIFRKITEIWKRRRGRRRDGSESFKRGNEFNKFWNWMNEKFWWSLLDCCFAFIDFSIVHLWAMMIFWSTKEVSKLLSVRTAPEGWSLMTFESEATT